MNDLTENPPADEKQTQLEAAKASFKQAKEAVKAARKAASQAKENLQALKADFKKAAVKKSKKSKKID
jgi:ribosome recycling factor